MQIYVAIADEKAGPFTLFQVEERLRTGELNDDSLAWHDGLAEWQPLKELAPFESYFRLRDVELEKERRRKEAENLAEFERRQALALPKSAVRPWTRFWARHLDFFFFLTACLLIFNGLRQIGWLEADIQRFDAVFPMFLPLWHLLEAYAISRWGTTAGKAMLGIHISDREKSPLSFNASVRRSLGVYVLGMGCYLFPLSLIAPVFGYFLLQKNKRSFWDVSSDSYVHHAPFQARHVLVPLAIVFLLFTLFQGPFAELANHHSDQMEVMRDKIGGQTN